MSFTSTGLGEEFHSCCFVVLLPLVTCTREVPALDIIKKVGWFRVALVALLLALVVVHAFPGYERGSRK